VLLAQGGVRLFPRHDHEMQGAVSAHRISSHCPIPRNGHEMLGALSRPARQPSQIGPDHGSQLRIAANSLRIGQQHDGLAVGGHLNCPRGDAVRDNVGMLRRAVRQRWPRQPHAHAVTLGVTRQPLSHSAASAPAAK